MLHNNNCCHAKEAQAELVYSQEGTTGRKKYFYFDFLYMGFITWCSHCTGIEYFAIVFPHPHIFSVKPIKNIFLTPEVKFLTGLR